MTSPTDDQTADRPVDPASSTPAFDLRASVERRIGADALDLMAARAEVEHLRAEIERRDVEITRLRAAAVPAGA